MIKINDLTPEEQLKEIYDQMKGFRVTNKHRKKCTIKCIEQVLEQLYQMWDYHNVKIKWHHTDQCKYWSEVLRLAEKL